MYWCDMGMRAPYNGLAAKPIANHSGRKEVCKLGRKVCSVKGEGSDQASGFFKKEGRSRYRCI